jgi:hypothetical protein
VASVAIAQLESHAKDGENASQNRERYQRNGHHGRSSPSQKQKAKRRTGYQQSNPRPPTTVNLPCEISDSSGDNTITTPLPERTRSPADRQAPEPHDLIFAARRQPRPSGLTATDTSERVALRLSFTPLGPGV